MIPKTGPGIIDVGVYTWSRRRLKLGKGARSPSFQQARLPCAEQTLATMPISLQKKTATKAKKKSSTFVVDCSKPVEDKIMEVRAR